VIVFAFLGLAIVSGRWSKDKVLELEWNEVGLWANCSCFDVEGLYCSHLLQGLHTVQGFSLIAGVPEFLLVLLLVYEYTFSRGNANVYTFSTILLVIALLANIVSWCVFAGIFTKNNFCDDGRNSFKQQHWILSWGFAFRLMEMAFAFVLLIITALNKAKGAERAATHKVGLLWAVILLLLNVLSTSGRGWMWNKQLGESMSDLLGDSGGFSDDVVEYDWEFGLWDVCYCKQSFRSDCTPYRRREYVAETFQVVAIFFQFLFIAHLLGGAVAKRGQIVTGILSAISLIIVLVTFREFFMNSYCDLAPLNETEQLHWGYGIEGVALIAQVFALILVFLTPGEAPAEEPKPTEPTSGV